jgi:deoxyribodipyrimidine photo-lyase
MRALLASFLCHHLWHHWLHAANHLARQFLDFEPGIHYPQLQMQAGLVGIHTIRIYNPVKQALEHDPSATFIKKWVPELSSLPNQLALQPWAISPLEETFLGFKPGVQYPKPIVNIEETGAFAANMLWKLKQQKEVQREAEKILAKHTLPNRMP